MKDLYKIELPAHYLETILQLLAENEPEILDVILDQIDSEEFEAEFRPLDKDVSDVVRENDEGHQMTDVEADADTLKSAGMGTDEDYHADDERI
jgi:hypothetical protein